MPRTLASALLALTLALFHASCARAAGEGEMCGGIAGIPCADGLFCEMDPSTQCGAGDMAGVCAPRPQMCTRIYKPVCGCDGKTYGNDCERQGAGVGKASEGPCGAG